MFCQPRSRSENFKHKKIDMHATYFYDEELPKFVGTWVWQSGSDRFEIEIIKGVMNFGEISMETALGGVKYIKNGAVINDQMQTSYSTYASSYLWKCYARKYSYHDNQ